MRSLLFVCMLIYGLESIFGTSVVINNGTVYVDEKPVDLKKAEVMEEMPAYTRYMFHSGDNNITITKMKFGNGISVATSSKMTPEEAAKAAEFSKKLSEKINKKVEKIQNEVDKEIKDMNEKLNKHFKSIFGDFGIF